MLLDKEAFVNILPIENVLFREIPISPLTNLEREKPVGFLTYEVNIESHVSHSKAKQFVTRMSRKAVLSG